MKWVRVVSVALCISCGAERHLRSDDEPDDIGQNEAEGWSPVQPAPPSRDAAEPVLVRSPYLQRVGPTEATIVWRTAGEGMDTALDYGPDDDPLSIHATGDTLARASGEDDHVVRLTALEPSTRYAVRIEAVADLTFTTSPTAGEPTAFTAWVAGDTGRGEDKHGDHPQSAVLEGMELATDDTPPDFVLFLGDIAYRDGTDEEFTQNHFGPFVELLNERPSWPVLGNHEGSDGVSVAADESGPYFDAFELPRFAEIGGASSQTEAYYSFDYANAHFVMLDSDSSGVGPGSEQLAWLEADLAATDATWVVACMHHPPYTKGSHDSDLPTDSGGRMGAIRDSVLPVLEAAGVDLVLAGHSHVYERSYPVRAGVVVDPRDGLDEPYAKSEGTIYIVAGNGSLADDKYAGEHEVMVLEEATLGSGLLTIDGDTLRWDGIDSAGSVIDSFTITHAPHRWVAFNDLRALAEDENAANVTLFGYDDAGALLDIDSGEPVGVEFSGQTYTTGDGECLDVGQDCLDEVPNGTVVTAGTDADLVFGEHVDLHGIAELDDPLWVNAMVLDNLDPSAYYRIAVTANRGQPNYAAARHTRVRLANALEYEARPSPGVAVEEAGAAPGHRHGLQHRGGRRGPVVQRTPRPGRVRAHRVELGQRRGRHAPGKPQGLRHGGPSHRAVAHALGLDSRVREGIAARGCPSFPPMRCDRRSVSVILVCLCGCPTDSTGSASSGSGIDSQGMATSAETEGASEETAASTDDSDPDPDPDPDPGSSSSSSSSGDGYSTGVGADARVRKRTAT